MSSQEALTSQRPTPWHIALGHLKRPRRRLVFISIGSINPTLSHKRYYEAHELILRAWTEVGPFRHHGRHFKFDYVYLWPRPFQEPHPPVWVPSQGSSETIEWAAAAERKYTYA